MKTEQLFIITQNENMERPDYKCKYCGKEWDFVHPNSVASLVLHAKRHFIIPYRHKLDSNHE